VVPYAKMLVGIGIFNFPISMAEAAILRLPLGLDWIGIWDEESGSG
jgi:hypothetical protein